jgi:hypothetical protein
MTQSTLHLRNPLDAFTTYSTHFVMIAARTTENARAFMNPANNRETLAAIEATKQLGDAIPNVGGPLRGDCFLVMDTRRFSQFTVESMKYEVYVNGLSKGQAHSNLATTIEMTVLDSVGISFINFMQWLMDVKLQTNFDGMIFLIRVIFVGHNQDGSTETVQSLTIPAHLFKMEVDLNYAKGVYTLEFMPNMNFSVFKHNRWTHIGTASGFNGIGGKTLGGVVRAFEEALNKKSKDFFEQSTAKLLQAGKPPLETTKKFGRLVRYQITLPGDWEGREFFGSWKNSVNGSIERNFKAELEKLDASKKQTPEGSKATDGTTSPAKSVRVSVEMGVTITEVLDIMFKQVPAIASFANAEKVSDPNGVAKFYKHVVSITSSDELVIVHVDVVAFEVPNAQPPSAVKITNEKQAERVAAEAREAAEKRSPYTTVIENGVSKRIPKSYFELDYIFTGQNTQVLNFDMKIQNLVFLLAANTKVSEGEMVHKVRTGQEANPEAEKRAPPRELLSLRPYDPLLLPIATAVVKENFSFLSAASRDKDAQNQVNSNLQEYVRNLSAFYAISPIQTAVSIKGNPDIMLKFSSPQLPEHSSFATLGAAGTSASNEEVRAAYRKKFEETVLKLGGRELTAGGDGVFTLNRQLGNDTYMTGPVFVKVNIKGPNVDFRTNQLVDGQDFASEVLLDNYYVVFKVVNKIENGVFTQDLELWSHNVFGSTKLTESTTRQPGGVAE